MKKDIQAQIARAKELYEQLYSQCNDDIKNGQISNKTKNLIQEVLTKSRSILDQLFYQLFINYFPETTEKERKRLYFPIFHDKSSFEKSKNINKLAKKHQKFYLLLEKVQPYHKKNEWLLDLVRYVNERHRNLTQVTHLEHKLLVIGNPTSASYINNVNPRAIFCIMDGAIISGKAEFLACKINNVDIFKLELDKDTPLNAIDPELTPRNEVGITFTLADTEIDALWLCKKAVDEIEIYADKVLELVGDSA